MDPMANTVPTGTVHQDFKSNSLVKYVPGKPDWNGLEGSLGESGLTGSMISSPGCPAAIRRAFMYARTLE